MDCEQLTDYLSYERSAQPLVCWVNPQAGGETRMVLTVEGGAVCGWYRWSG